MEPTLKQNIPDHSVTECDESQHVFVGLVVLLHSFKGVHAEVLLLDSNELSNVVLELIVSQLLEVVLAADHVLDQLGDLLVELDHIWLLVNKFNNLLPFSEKSVSVYLLLSTSETSNDLAEHLTGSHGLWLWLLDSEQVIVTVKFDAFKGLEHLLLDNFFSKWNHDHVVSLVVRKSGDMASG